MHESLVMMLEGWPEEVRDRVFAADRVLMGRVPGMKRQADPADRLIGYTLGAGYKGTLFIILLSKTGVKIGFSYGATLADPSGLLGGTGKVHRTFTVRSPEDVDQSAFLALLDEAHTAYRERTGQLN